MGEHALTSLVKPKWLAITAIVIVVIAAADAILLATHWPFTRRAVTKSLEDAASARVEIQRFHTVFFPYPGCVAEGVVVHHPDDSSGPPLLTIGRLTVQGDYYRLATLSKNVRFIHTDGMHIRIRAGKQRSNGGNAKPGASLSIDALVADKTVLEFASKEKGHPPFVIDIQHAKLSPVSGHRVLNFETDLHIPTPPGEVHGTGQFGPWNENEPFATHTSGSYTFRHADLGFAGGIAGMLESQGRYQGSIRQIEVTGSTVVPDFRVAGANHPAALTARFQATVNGETGDVALHTISGHFRHSDVTGSGSVAGETPSGDKVVSLELEVPRGRIDDFLYLLTQESRPGLVGSFRVRTSVIFPTTAEPFLRRLRMDGKFQIADGHFTAASTEEALDRIRDRSRGEPTDYAADAISNLRGSAIVAEGIAQLPNITFDVSGASARLSGTYNLISTNLDLRGTAHLDTTVSNATTGVKSFFLKVLNPFFKSKQHKGSDVPIKITGKYGNTSVSIDFGRRSDKSMGR